MAFGNFVAMYFGPDGNKMFHYVIRSVFTTFDPRIGTKIGCFSENSNKIWFFSRISLSLHPILRIGIDENNNACLWNSARSHKDGSAG